MTQADAVARAPSVVRLGSLRRPASEKVEPLPVRTVPAYTAADDDPHADEPVAVARADARPTRRLLGLAIALVLLPLLLQAIRLLVDLGGRVWNPGDLAITELSIHDVGVHPVWLGPYSRFHFNHPGPLLFYVLAPVYRLFGTRSVSLSIGALAINGAACAGILVVAWQRGGRRLVLWTAVLLAVWMRFLGAPLLQNAWNPFVTVLPFGLVVVLAWSIACGSTRSLAPAVFVASFVVQTHIGYTPATVAVLGAAIVLGAADVVHSARAATGPRRRAVVVDALRWLAVAAVVGVVVWLPPIVEQFRHHPGNLTRIDQFFEHAKPTVGVHQMMRVTLQQLGGIPRALLPLSAQQRAAPSGYGFGVVTLVVFGAATALAVRRRMPDVLRLAVLNVVLFAAAAWSVLRIAGGFEVYLVTWISAASFTAWLGIGASVLGDGRTPAPVRWPRAARLHVPPEWRRAAPAVLLVAFFVGTAFTVQAAADVANSEPKPDVMRVLAQRTLAATRGDHRPVLVVNQAQEWPWAAGLILQLEKHGVAARVPPAWGWLYGARLAVHPERAGETLTVTPATAPPAPQPGLRRVASSGGVAVYLAPRTPGAPLPANLPVPG